MKHQYVFFMFVVGFSFFATSCEMLEPIFNEEEVIVHLPAVPLAARRTGMTEPVWTLRWFPAGSTSGEQCIHGRTGVVVLEKGRFTPILAELTNTDPRYGPYPIAGSVYPALACSSMKTAEIHAGWAGGSAALAAKYAISSADGGSEIAGVILSRFNWSRLVQEIATMDSPEYLDYTRLVPALLSGEFRVYDIKPRPLHPYRIIVKNILPEPGDEFFSVWPGKTAFVWPGPSGISIEIPEGTTRFYGSSGYITIQNGTGSGNDAFFMPYSLQEADSSSTVTRYENDCHGNSLPYASRFVHGTDSFP